MKIGIVTYHFSDNYGALYQAYSLREWFRRRGAVADFINYQPPYVEEGGRLDRPWKRSLWRKNATILYMKQAHIRRRFLGDRRLTAAFDQFRSEHLGVGLPRLRRAEDLGPRTEGYDMLVCGSDQIWNPSIQRGLDPAYFLDIPGSEGIRKIAYAPSFGRSAIEPQYLPELRRLLEQLDAISVRENSGLDILESAGLARDRAIVVPDPTILLGNFDALLSTKNELDTSVFCYALRTDELIRDVAEEAARSSGGPLYAPRNPHQRWRDIGEGVTLGPREWLDMLARAGMVVSNSFHGIALSVVMNKQFVAVSLPGKRSAMNSRVHNLLTLAGLTDRILDTADPVRVRELVRTPIRWEQANERIAAARKTAEAYLDKNIEMASSIVRSSIASGALK